jgi:hypothetical protein
VYPLCGCCALRDDQRCYPLPRAAPSSAGISRGRFEDGFRDDRVSLIDQVVILVISFLPGGARWRATWLVMAALTLLTVPGCRDTGNDTAGAQAARATPSAPASAPTSAAPSAGGAAGGYCHEIHDRAPRMNLLLSKTFAEQAPAAVRAAFDGMDRELHALRAVAPAELGNAYDVIIRDWQSARSATERAGWSRNTAREQVLGMTSERHLTAVSDVDSYIERHCH